MLIKKIILKNIRSYEYQEINFPNGSILLSGDIGSGKTSILLGIEFALFGLQPGQRGSALLRNGVNEGGVVIEFEVDDKKIIVERNLKRGKTISQDYCAISVDGDKQEIAVTELKNTVLELLNYPKEFSKKQNILYKFTVYTPQEEMKQIILQDSETRINTLRHVFGIDKYKKILENTSIVASKLREEKRRKEGITETLEYDKLNLISKENELEIKKNNSVLAEGELFLKAEKRKEVQDEKEKIFKKIEEKLKLQQELDKAKIMISNKKQILLENNKFIDDIKEQITNLEKLSFDESEIKTLERNINFKKGEKEKLDEHVLETNSQIASLNLKNEENKKLELKISNLEICPTCLQSVDAVYRANVLNKLHSDSAENIRKLKELTTEKILVQEKIKIINAEISKTEKRVQELNILKVRLQEIQEKKTRLQDLEKINLSLVKDIEMLNQHAETLKTFILELEKFDAVFQLKQ